MAGLCLGTGASGAADVTVAVAANFAAPMKEIAAAFERQSGHKAVLSFGSTGALHAQVLHGAPFEVFLSADDTTAARLESQGRAVAGSRFIYATGRLVLWSPQSGVVDEGGEVLAALGQRRVAVAHPRLSPYGAAAHEVIDRMGWRSQVQPRIVQGDNIAQVHQFVASGNAAMGFVALSQVMQHGRMVAGSSWLVPVTLHRPLRQEAVLLSRGADSAAARAMLEFLRGPQARAIMVTRGYEVDPKVSP